MSLRQKYSKALSGLMPAGAVGLSLFLGLAASTEAKQHSQPAAANPSSVSERLSAIRQAVSDLTGTVSERGKKELQLAWGNWRNGGWRNGGWGNWRNGWHNGGWHNWWHNW
jgi:hypothetical protein